MQMKCLKERKITIPKERKVEREGYDYTDEKKC